MAGHLHVLGAGLHCAEFPAGRWGASVRRGLDLYTGSVTLSVMRLIDHLAARRHLYHRALPTLPDIMVIDVPPEYAASTLPLGRYYPVILETLAERHEFEAFLCAPRPRLVPPSLLDRRPSAMVTDSVLLARSAPPSRDWPWLLLCCWPPAYTAMVSAQNDYFARGTYTIELFPTLRELERAEAILNASLGPDNARQVRHIDAFAGRA